MNDYDGVLITFGCSWTYGVGVGYKPNMGEKQYRSICQDKEINNQKSFRGILSKKYNLLNINFAKGGHSNQAMYRIAKEFFISKNFKNLQKQYKNIIVLWGITSIARNDVFFNGSYHNVKYDKTKNYPIEIQNFVESYLNCSYNKENETQKISTEIQFFNNYFKSNNIKNIWFDTFNHNDYKLPDGNHNIIFQSKNNRDMLSQMALVFSDNVDNKFHFSSWKKDTNRIKVLIKQGYINPISYHPTEIGHELISEFIESELEKLIG